ncbi:MAG: hypothetical protein QM775_30905 [Pirellulales bacterium]
MSTLHLPPGITYDAAAILGLGEAACEPLSVAEPGEMVIHVGAWSLQDLRTCKTVVRHSLMYNQDWYNGHPFSHEKLTPGVYRVRLQIPDSNRKTFAEQRELLCDGEVVAPAVLVATALFCHLKQAGQDLLGNDWTRCADPHPGGSRVTLGVCQGRVVVLSFFADCPRKHVWLAGCRTS